MNWPIKLIGLSHSPGFNSPAWKIAFACRGAGPADNGGIQNARDGDENKIRVGVTPP
jgi:hypothetical protein